MHRVHNFNAGPAALPLEVLEQAREEMLDFAGSGMSVMEISHRSGEFKTINDAAEANVRKLMGLSDDQAVLFLQGGASLQFAMIPLNLRRPGGSVSCVDTGSWAGKAIKEAALTGPVDVVWSGAEEGYTRTPRPEEIVVMPDAEYLHICSNETIGGIRFAEFPRCSVPLVADMSSEIMSRVIDAASFDLIYAGAQKNIGPSGLALVIIRKELMERVPDSVPVFLRYKTHFKESSLYNTPNTWGIYILKLVTDRLLAGGGIAAVQKENEAKAALLYGIIDGSDFWCSPVERGSRSLMNIVWRLPSEELEEAFVSEAKKAGMIGLKGHRSVGGIRASIYNAVTMDSVRALVDFMNDFEARKG